MGKNLDKFAIDLKSMNSALTENHQFDTSYHKPTEKTTNKEDSLDNLNDELFFLPYTGNGYLGLSFKSKLGIFINFHKNLNLQSYFNPLVEIYSDRLTKYGI